MRRIVYSRLDGGVSVVLPVLNTLGEAADFTEADAEQRAWDKLPADAINPRFVDVSEVPQDRTFRNAWKDSGAAITVDTAKAQDLTKERLRIERAPLFEANDIALRDAIITDDKAAKDAAIVERDRLRDITATVDAVTDIEALKALKAAK